MKVTEKIIKYHLFKALTVLIKMTTHYLVLPFMIQFYKVVVLVTQILFNMSVSSFVLSSLKYLIMERKPFSSCVFDTFHYMTYVMCSHSHSLVELLIQCLQTVNTVCGKAPQNSFFFKENCTELPFKFMSCKTD